MADRMNAAQLAELLKALTPLMTPKPQLETPPALSIQDEEPAAPAPPQKRCGCDGCRKKLALTDLACGKCKTRFCGTHRLPELHACAHDFRKEGAAQLAAANPRVVADKIQRV